MSRASATESPPAFVGPYLIQDRLGAGGMGEVYRAWDRRLERAVAVKKVLAKDAWKEKNRERIRSEARAVAGLSHPAIVRVFDLLETEDSDWIVMELVEGRTLRSLLKTRAIVETEAIALAREITEGLSVAHRKGLVHRDLKSENVMVTHLGHVKILDFGLAQHFDEDAGSAPGSAPRNRVVGTSRAMSPEQARGLPLDPRSDLFSLGSLLYEMVTGQAPFQGPSNYVTMTRVCYHRQRPAREVNPETSPELSNFIDHLLEKDPRRRPESAEEVSAVLDSLAGIAPLAPSLVYLLWPTESTVMDSAALSDSTADIPRFLPKSILSRDDLRSSIFIWTALATDLTNAAALLRRCGDEPASRIFLQYDRTVRDLLAQFSGIEIDKANGFVLLFRRPIDAVRFALTMMRRLAGLADEMEVELAARVGVHVGELHLRENPAADVERGAKRFEAEGHTKAIATRVLHAARPGQILITQGVYELARLAKLNLGDSEPQVAWKEHSRQGLADLDEVIRIFEVVYAGPRALDRSGSGETEAAPRGRQRRGVRIVLVCGALLALLAAVLVTVF